MHYEITAYAEDIIKSSGMEIEKGCVHHKIKTCYLHSVEVALVSLWLSDILHIKVQRRSMVRGALLHDYFLYDRRKTKPNGPHGFIHSKIALENAIRDFSVNEIEQDIILKHMFPLNIAPPKYKESIIVSLADKLCATNDAISYCLSAVRSISLRRSKTNKQ